MECEIPLSDRGQQVLCQNILTFGAYHYPVYLDKISWPGRDALGLLPPATTTVPHSGKGVHWIMSSIGIVPNYLLGQGPKRLTFLLLDHNTFSHMVWGWLNKYFLIIQTGLDLLFWKKGLPSCHPLPRPDGQNTELLVTCKEWLVRAKNSCSSFSVPLRSSSPRSFLALGELSFFCNFSVVLHFLHWCSFWQLIDQLHLICIAQYLK